MACIWYMASFGVVTLCLDFASRQSSHHLYGPRLHRIVPCLSLSLLPAPFFFSTVWASRICFVPLKTKKSHLLFTKQKQTILWKLRMFCFRYMFFSQPYPKKRHFWSSMLRDVLSSVRKLKKKTIEKKQISKKSLKTCAHPAQHIWVFVSSFWGPTGKPEGNPSTPPPSRPTGPILKRSSTFPSQGTCGSRTCGHGRVPSAKGMIIRIEKIIQLPQILLVSGIPLHKFCFALQKFHPWFSSSIWDQQITAETNNSTAGPTFWRLPIGHGGHGRVVARTASVVRPDLVATHLRTLAEFLAKCFTCGSSCAFIKTDLDKKHMNAKYICHHIITSNIWLCHEFGIEEQTHKRQ